MIQTPDLINGIFETFGGFFVLASCLRALRDKYIAGVSVYTIIFFTSWGFWNLFYYPHLNQTFSFWGGVFLVLMNAWWVGLILKYRKKE